MNNQKYQFALVDPIRTSKSLIAELEKRQIEFILIESGLAGAIPPYPHPIFKTESFESLVLQLSALNLKNIIGCVDPSILFADELGRALKIPNHGLELSQARRHKKLMSEAIRASGLRTPNQFESAQLADILNWVKQNGFPCVVKPTSSGGSDHVYLCNKDEEIISAFNSILFQVNLMGARNESVLIQEYIDGTEFYVDSVSYKGTHIPVDIFQYKKGHHNGHSFIYEKEYFINSDDPNWENLAVFSQKALDALQFHTGPSHMEVKINSKDEIVFIEVGARLSGGDTHLLTQETRLDGLSQVQLSIDAYLDLPAPERKYSSKKFGIRNYIVSNKKGVLKKYKSIEQIQKLNSFSRMNLVYKEGSTIKPTIDMASDAGWIDLSHSNKNQISNDEKILDQLLFEGIFCLE